MTVIDSIIQIIEKNNKYYVFNFNVYKLMTVLHQISYIFHGLKCNLYSYMLYFFNNK